MDKFYNEEKPLVLSELKTTETGLTTQEVANRLEQYGKNELSEGKKRSKLAKFFDQFKDVMIIVLIAAALVSAAVTIYNAARPGGTGEYGELFDSALILLIVILNAIIGFVQENKAEAALEALKSMNKPYSKVIRDGRLQSVKSDEIVIGDVVELEAGDIVPADMRLLTSASLKIEEAALTGESVPVEKFADNIVRDEAPLGDRVNMAYSTGVVTYGRGQGVVVGTGMSTEVGKIATMLNENSDNSTPLQKQLAKTAKVLSVMVLVIAVIIFAASIIRHLIGNTGDILEVVIDSFMTAVAIAVAAIPEGLPAVVTIVLAIGVQRMSKRKAIIRNLPAVETLGSCEIICSDKTGTLTLNKMTVKKTYTPANGLIPSDDFRNDSEDFKLFVRGLVLCNDTHFGDKDTLIGDPTETALYSYAMLHGLSVKDMCDSYKRVDEVPFDSIRKLMTTCNNIDGTTVAHIKGAPDILIKKCNRIFINGEVRAITAQDVEAITKANDDMCEEALRVLAVAVKFDDLSHDTVESDMVFVGLVGMIDPPRPEVKSAVAVCHKAGMTPIMITGDHRNTAAAIAREIGILTEDKKVMEGKEIDALSDEEFADCIRDYAVFARVSPENKVRIVKAYRAMDKVVAMTGDGVNDAPSIKEADIGIGMGITGTDVSKGASDMVLADDNFATIVGAVEEGRKIYSNIKKAIQFLLSANIAEVLCLFLVTIFAIGGAEAEFLTPVMILWINLVTDSLPALALGMEEAEKDVMDHPPRKSKASLFAGRTGKDIFIQGFIQTGLVMLSYCLGCYLPAFSADHTIGMTMAFVTLCTIQLFHAYNLKSQTNSIFNKKLFKNKMLNLSFFVGFILMLMTIVIRPFGELFGTYQLTAIEWAISLVVAIAIVPLVELQKLIEKAILKRRGKPIID